ncbi:MAG: hypothetical protein WCF85_19015 [Rhodospirillaceae bacterium]
MNIEQSPVVSAIKAFDQSCTDAMNAVISFYRTGATPDYNHADATLIAQATAKTINDVILKLEWGVEMMDEFTVFDDGISDDLFETIKAALSDLRKLTN